MKKAQKESGEQKKKSRNNEQKKLSHTDFVCGEIFSLLIKQYS